MPSIQCPPLPADTARAAESIFGREHPYLRIGETLENLWKDLNLSMLGAVDPFLINSSYPYSLATVVQFWEGLTDRQMSQATRTRLDVKYALHLPLNFPGVDSPTLCEFRQHLLMDINAMNTLQGAISHLSKFAKPESTTVTAYQMIKTICLPNRVELILECMEISLEAVASRNPDWLKMYAMPHWYQRYSQKPNHQKIPRKAREIDALILSVGNDGLHLLNVIKDSNAVALSNLREIHVLRSEWHRQFAMEEGVLKFRRSHCLSCSSDLGFIKTISTRKEDASAEDKQLGSI